MLLQVLCVTFLNTYFNTNRQWSLAQFYLKCYRITRKKISMSLMQLSNLIMLGNVSCLSDVISLNITVLNLISKLCLRDSSFNETFDVTFEWYTTLLIAQ